MRSSYFVCSTDAIPSLGTFIFWYQQLHWYGQNLKFLDGRFERVAFGVLEPQLFAAQLVKIARFVDF